MTVSPVVAQPAVITDLVAAFADLLPSASSPAPSPTDPFAILLEAAADPTSEPAASSTAPSDPDAATGTLASQLVSLPTEDSDSASGSAIVGEAEQFLGVPYLWGGSSPSTGFDCSGLVQYVFGQLGVSLPRTAAEQEQVGTPVASLADAQPGDLLFFEPGQNGAPAGEAGHVAIYIGNDEMIAAPETGENVQIQQVPTTPLAIRQVAAPGAETAATDDADGPAVQMGNVAVPAQYVGVIEQASASTGTPASLIAAIVYNESRFDPGAVSSAGAEGIAQFMPGTAAANGVDPFDPTSAITGAASLLAQYHSVFGSWSDAIAAYAAGGAATEAAGGVPEDGSTPSYVASALALAGMPTGS